MRHRRRRCSACQRLFTPDPRVAKCQRACSREECQKRRHAAARADWVLRHPGYFRDRGAKHRAYREAVKAGTRVPEQRANPVRGGDQGEQDATLTQDKQREDLEPTLPGPREQDAILAQVLLLLAFGARLLWGGGPASKTSLERPGTPGLLPSVERTPSSRATTWSRSRPSDPTLVNAHAEARRDGDATLRDQRLR